MLTLGDNEISLHTKPSQAVEKPKGGLDRFICHFCNSIVVDPVLDSNCAYSFCRSCVAQNLVKGAACPLSDCGEPFEAKEISNMQRREMERITVVCEQEDCKQEYAFNQTLLHRRQCYVKKTPCINNCSSGELYKGVDAHLVHVTDECVKTKVICKRCRHKCAREEFETHNCVVGFIN